MPVTFGAPLLVCRAATLRWRSVRRGVRAPACRLANLPFCLTLPAFLWQREAFTDVRAAGAQIQPAHSTS